MTGAPDDCILAIPSKGRLMEDTQALFARAGLEIEKTGHERGYRGRIRELDGVVVAFLSASEIASHLSQGVIHMGVTGEDLVRETIADADRKVEFRTPLGFGHADVVTAVPESWLDVNTMVDLDDAAATYHVRHGRRLRVATKYMTLTREFFARMGISGYRIVESLGATEGAPAAGAAEVVVDITSTGSTLAANHLRILDDGIILRSQANLVSSRTAPWPDAVKRLCDDVVSRIAQAVEQG